MKKKEIKEVLEENFKRVNKYFYKALNDFEEGDISEYRIQIKKLKVFLHLLNMESDDGFSFRITKKAKTIYGYFGIIQNLNQLIEEVRKYEQNTDEYNGAYLLEILKSERAYRKKIIKTLAGMDIDPLVNLRGAEAVLPAELSGESIKRFVNYTLFELQSLTCYAKDECIDNFRKLLEDLYFNYHFIKPFIVQYETNWFNEREMRECLKLFGDYREKCMSIALLHLINTEALNDNERQFLVKLENDKLCDKKELNNQIIAKMNSMRIKSRSLMDLTSAGYLGK